MPYNPLTNTFTLSSGRSLSLGRDRIASQQATDEELLQARESLGSQAYGAITGLFNVLDLPASVIRDVVTGNNPIDQFATPFSQANRQSFIPKGAGFKDPSFYGGLAGEILLDPLTYLSLGASAYTKLGEAARKAGVIDDLLKQNAKALNRGAQVPGKRELLMTTKFSDLPEAAREKVASKLGMPVEKVIDEPLSTFGRVSAQPLGIDPINFWGGSKSLAAARGLDALGQHIRYSLPGREFAKRFMPSAMNESGKLAQKFATEQFEDFSAITDASRERAATMGMIFRTPVQVPKLVPVDEFKSKFVPGDLRTLDKREVRRLLEGVDKMPEWYPENMKQAISSMRDEYQRGLRHLRDMGVNAKEFFSETDSKYTARQAVLGRYTSKEHFEKHLGEYHHFGKDAAFDPNDIARIGPFRNIEGETDTLIEIMSDPQLSRIIDSGGSLDVLEYVLTKKYGHLIPTEFVNAKTGKAMNQRKELAKIMYKLPAESRQIGLFPNDPVYDMMLRMENMLGRESLVENSLGWMAGHAVRESDGPTIAALTRDLKLRRGGQLVRAAGPPNEFDEALKGTKKVTADNSRAVFDRLPPEVRDEIDRMFDEHGVIDAARAEIDQARAEMRKLLPQHRRLPEKFRKLEKTLDDPGKLEKFVDQKYAEHLADQINMRRDTKPKKPRKITAAEYNEQLKYIHEDLAGAGGPKATTGAIDQIVERLPDSVKGEIEQAWNVARDEIVEDIQFKAMADPKAYPKFVEMANDPDKMFEYLAGQKTKFIRGQVGQLKVPQELADVVRNLHGQFNDPKTIANAKGFFQSFTNYFKGTVTQPWLSYHTRNGYGGQGVNWISGFYGSPANPRSIANGIRLITEVDKFGRGKSKILPSAKNIPAVQEEWARRQVEQFGPVAAKSPLTDEEATKIIQEWEFKYDLSHRTPLRAKEQLELSKGLPASATGVGDSADLSARPLASRDIEFAGDKPFAGWRELANTFIGREEGVTWKDPLGVRGVAGREVSTLPPVAAGEQLTARIENSNRIPPWLGLMEQGYNPAKAASMVKGAQIDYSPRNFTDFERNVMKKMFPFYSWTSRMLPYTLRSLVDNPSLRGVVRSQERAVEHQEQYIPDRYRRQPAFLVGDLDEKGYQQVISNFDLAHNAALEPFQVGPTLPGTLKRTGRGIIGNMHPLLRYGIEQGMGVQAFSGRNVEELEGGVSRLAQNVGEMVGVETPKLSQPIDNLLLSLGGARFVAPLRQATDPRTTLAEKAVQLPVNLLTGAKIATYDPAQELGTALSEQFREIGVSGRNVLPYERLYVREGREKFLTPQEELLRKATNRAKEDARRIREARDLLQNATGE